VYNGFGEMNCKSSEKLTRVNSEEMIPCASKGVDTFFGGLLLRLLPDLERSDCRTFITINKDQLVHMSKDNRNSNENLLGIWEINFLFSTQFNRKRLLMKARTVKEKCK
jgi:hypothetical protein